MDTTFPFGLPLPTAFYLTCYVVTLMIHVVFMNYVLAGSFALTIAWLRPTDRGTAASTKILKEWMPFMLSGAITAGIAPLLFLQILYKHSYYTANLLLFNRWMAILPVLIIGFYSLYLLKSNWLHRRQVWIAVAVAWLPALCVAFVGYSWTENHLLSVRDPTFWGQFYADRSEFYHDPQLLPRLLVWATGSIPTLVLLLAWQHWYLGTGRAVGLARMAGVGFLAVGIAVFWYDSIADEKIRQAFTSGAAIFWFVAACAGLMLQILGWGWIGFTNHLDFRKLLVLSLGLLLTVGGMTVCREVGRITTIGPERFEALYPIHAEAFGKAGLLLFLGFFTINALLIAFIFWLVRHHSVEKTETVQ